MENNINKKILQGLNEAQNREEGLRFQEIVELVKDDDNYHRAIKKIKQLNSTSIYSMRKEIENDYSIDIDHMLFNELEEPALDLIKKINKKFKESFKLAKDNNIFIFFSTLGSGESILSDYINMGWYQYSAYITDFDINDNRDFSENFVYLEVSAQTSKLGFWEKIKQRYFTKKLKKFKIPLSKIYNLSTRGVDGIPMLSIESRLDDFNV